MGLGALHRLGEANLDTNFKFLAESRGLVFYAHYNRFANELSMKGYITEEMRKTNLRTEVLKVFSQDRV